MRIIRAKDYDDMSCKAAAIIGAQVILNPRSVIGLATGSTPLGTYKCLIKGCEEGNIDFAEVRSVNLDEYAGLGPNDEQSYRRFMDENLFKHINIDKANTHVPNGLAKDSTAECNRYEELIRACGGIDLQLLGIGNNGHIGFNEPNESFVRQTQKVALTESTIKANMRFFEKKDDVPRYAYTMGIGTIMLAKRIVLIVSGEQKADILKKAVQGSITPHIPASVLQMHPRITLVADAAALSALNERA